MPCHIAACRRPPACWRARCCASRGPRRVPRAPLRRGRGRRAARPWLPRRRRRARGRGQTPSCSTLSSDATSLTLRARRGRSARSSRRARTRASRQSRRDSTLATRRLMVRALVRLRARTRTRAHALRHHLSPLPYVSRRSPPGAPACATHARGTRSHTRARPHTEYVSAEALGSMTKYVLGIDDEPALRKLSEKLHAKGIKVRATVAHWRARSRSREPPLTTADADSSLHIGTPSTTCGWNSPRTSPQRWRRGLAVAALCRNPSRGSSSRSERARCAAPPACSVAVL